MSCCLNNENIAESVRELSQYCTSNKVDKKIVIQSTLALEEILLRYQDRFGKEHEYSVEVFKKFGLHHAKIEVKGEMYNPFEDSEDEISRYSQKLLAEMGIAPSHIYRKKTNQIDIRIERHKMSPIAILIFTLMLSVICGLIAKNILPGNVADTIANEIFRPLADTFASFITAIVGPVVFFTIIGATINIGDLSSLKKFGKSVLRNLFILSFTIFILSSIIPFVLAGVDKGVASESPFFIIRDTLLSIIPKNIVSPFLESSIPQLMFWGIAIGLALLVTGKQNSEVASVMISLNEVFGRIMAFVGSILPFYIFFSTFLTIYSELDKVFKGGLILLYYFAGVLAGLILMILFTYIFARVSPKILVKYALPSVLSASMACSSILPLPDVINNLSDPKKFAVDKRKADFVTPISQTLFKPMVAINIFTITMGVVGISGQQFSLSNVITLIILSIIFSIAAPPCAGSGMAVYTVLFQIFHLDMSLLPLTVTFDMLLNYITSGMGCFGNYVCVLIIDARTKNGKADLDKEKENNA